MISEMKLSGIFSRKWSQKNLQYDVAIFSGLVELCASCKLKSSFINFEKHS